MHTIGFIGLGVMGASMAQHLIEAGYRLRIYNRTKAKAQPLLNRGAVWCETPGNCVQGAEAAITMVGFPPDVEAVYFGEKGLLSQAAPGTYLIDMTTSSPSLAQRIYQAAKAKGVFALDAPVSGGDIGAKNATLSIMAGGDPEAFAACRPLFEAMGKTITLAGGPGAGQHTKAANQIAVAGAISGVCEAIAYARAAGLDVDTMYACISGGAAGSWQLANHGASILKGNDAPGFFIKHYIKDMDIARQAAEENGLTLPMLDTVLEMYRDFMAKNSQNGELGIQALIHYYHQS